MNLELLSYCSKAILLGGGIWAITRYSRLQTKVGKGIAQYFWFKCIFEIISTVTSFSENNFRWFYLYCILEAVFILEIVSMLPNMQKFSRFKRLLQVFFIIGIAFESILVWGVQVNTISRMAECVVLTGICFVAVMQIIFGHHLSNSFSLPQYWFLISVMIGLGSHFFIVGGINYHLAHKTLSYTREFWLFNYVSITLSNLLILVGLWVASKPISLAKSNELKL